LKVAAPELVSCAVPIRLLPAHDAEAALQNLTNPMWRLAEPELTPAVRVTVLPHETEAAAAAGVPDVIANVVLVVACDAWADGVHATASTRKTAIAILSCTGFESNWIAKERIQVTSSMFCDISRHKESRDTRVS
jgi:hypothetical protein